jgi:hypothetical protein
VGFFAYMITSQSMAYEIMSGLDPITGQFATLRFADIGIISEADIAHFMLVLWHSFGAARNVLM